MPPKKKPKTINTDKTQPTLFMLLNKDRASGPVSETQDSRIPRPKIIPSRTRRLLKSHARQILVSLAKKKSVLKWKKSKDRRMYELKTKLK